MYCWVPKRLLRLVRDTGGSIVNGERGRYFWVHRRLLGRGGGIHGVIQEDILGE